MQNNPLQLLFHLFNLIFFQLLCITMSGSAIYRNIDQAITKGDGTQKDLVQVIA